MGFGDIFVTVVLTYYTVYVLKIIFSKTNRENIKAANIELEKLRKIPNKTVEEQKKFIDLRYPKRKGKFQWRSLPMTILKFIPFLILYLFVFRSYRYIIFNLLGVEIKTWMAILFVILFPLILNYILDKFGVAKSGIREFL